MDSSKKQRCRELLECCLRNDEERVTSLMKTDIDVNYRNLHGETALYFASRVSMKLSLFLINQGADITARTMSNQSIFHQVAISGDVDFLNEIKDKPEAKKMFVGELRAWDGLSPVHLATKYGNPEVLKEFTAIGLNLNLKSWAGSVPLHFAIAYNRFDIALYLINQNVNINVRTYSFAIGLKKPHSPLHIMLHWPEVDATHELYDKLLVEMINNKARIRGCPQCKYKRPCNVFSKERFARYQELRIQFKSTQSGSLLKRMGSLSRSKKGTKRSSAAIPMVISENGIDVYENEDTLELTNEPIARLHAMRESGVPSPETAKLSPRSVESASCPDLVLRGPGKGGEKEEE